MRPGPQRPELRPTCPFVASFILLLLRFSEVNFKSKLCEKKSGKKLELSCPEIKLIFFKFQPTLRSQDLKIQSLIELTCVFFIAFARLEGRSEL